jgi:hypothetical protein
LQVVGRQEASSFDKKASTPAGVISSSLREPKVRLNRVTRLRSVA